MLLSFASLARQSAGRHTSVGVLDVLRRSLTSAASEADLEQASAPRAASEDVEAVPVTAAPDAAVLLRLKQRPFGAMPELPPYILEGVEYGASRSHIAVVRPAFTPFDEPPASLSALVAPLGGNAMALAASTQDPPSRVVVDEYVRTQRDGPFVLKSVATELAAFLKREGARTCLVPDVGQATTSTAAAAAAGPAQSSNHCLMVAPTAFGFNEQAAQDNSFMHAAQAPVAGSSLTRQVLHEYAGLHAALVDAGVRVSLFAHDLRHGTPDAVFPNNWFSTHPANEAGRQGGQSTLVLYPMKCPNRAAERRPEIVRALRADGAYPRLVDMTHHEKEHKFFEGTGVLVLDRVNGVAYVDLSERAHAELASAWVDALGYNKLVAFHSTDARGQAVYHTNVMMAVGSSVAVVCADSVADERERRQLLSALGATHEIVQISLAQMDALCGNVLELLDDRGLPVLAMSTQAYHAFTEEQRRALRRHAAKLVHAPIDTLERVGGGGVRCCIAELF